MYTNINFVIVLTIVVFSICLYSKFQEQKIPTQKDGWFLQLECSSSLLSQNSGSCRLLKLNPQRSY